MSELEQVEQLELGSIRAEFVVEQLRWGIPPVGLLRQFTVGRQEELRQLDADLRDGATGRATLVRANYGGGKSHLLNLVRDLALQQGYVTSLVVVNAGQGVRFNRMDQVLAAVCRDIQCPGSPGRGVMSLIRAYADTHAGELSDTAQEERAELEDEGRWRQPGLLQSSPLYIAVRAALVSDDDDVRDLVNDWLTRGEPDKLPRNELFERLVADLHVGDPRGRWEILRELGFRRDSYQPAWDALSDLDTLAKLSGYRGLILLFDEFEDVVQNLKNIAYETAAFENLFRFFSGDYAGSSYFAVTPDFARKCKDRLLMKGIYDFPAKRFDELPHFELSPIDFGDFINLCAQILDVHRQAYDWDPTTGLDLGEVRTFLHEQWDPNAPERIRTSTQLFVSVLDRHAEPPR